MEALDSVLNQLGQAHSLLDCVGNSLDNNGVVGVILGGVEEVPGSLEVSADADVSSDSDLVGRKWLFGLFDSLVGFCHLNLVKLCFYN